MNPYSTSTHDSPHFKRLYCGRKKQIEEIICLLTEGKSILLFGERRIGKTFTLFMIRDIINGTINDYAGELVDRDFYEWITIIRDEADGILSSVSQCKFINLQSFSPQDISDFQEKVKREFPSIQFHSSDSLSDLLLRIDANIRNRLVILIDEMELLLRLEAQQTQAIFQQLNSIIQTCKNISFVFAGADYWVRANKDGTSPLHGNCTAVFLPAPDKQATRKYLLNIPLGEWISDEENRSDCITQVLNKSGGKPFYCQALAYEIANGSSFGDAYDRVLKGCKAMIEAFFLDPPEPSNRILQLLAHFPRMSEKRIAATVSTSRQQTRSKLDDMQSLGKINCENGRFYLNGELFEEWGKRNIEVLKPKSIWIDQMRWILAAILFAISLFIAYYTNPTERDFVAITNQCKIVLTMPGSVEPGERGKLGFYVVTQVDSLLKDMNLHTGDGLARLWPMDGENWDFSNLASGKIRRHAAKFEVSNAAKGPDVVFKLISDKGELAEFKVPLRSFPVKAHWAVLSGIAAFFAAPIPFELLKTLIKRLTSVRLKVE